MFEILKTEINNISVVGKLNGLQNCWYKFFLITNVNMCQHVLEIQFNIVVKTLEICNRRQGLQPLTGFAQ